MKLLTYPSAFVHSPVRAAVRQPTAKPRYFYRMLLTATVIASLWGLPLAVQAATPADRKNPMVYTASSGRMTVDQHFNRGLQRVSQGDFSGAIADFTAVIQQQPDAIEGYSNRALAYVQVGNYAAALADVEQVLQRDPSNYEAINHRGIIRAQQGDFQAAVSDFTQSLSLKPNYAEAFYNRGMAYYSLENYPAAIADFTSALESQPNTAEIYGQRGLTHHAMGNRRRAMSDLRLAADLFQAQGNHAGHQQTLTLIEQIR